ncbi:MAG: pyridoxal-phosphate dependent enzyme [Clostridia bacterium]|nr:pyridoxal-phosphate dependent enzyme [Clostridia bacterium]
MKETIIHKLCDINECSFFIKREDYIPFSFGGNKARKAQLFFEKIDNGSYDCVVTYGSSSSNHCRVVANMASSRGMKCFIISPEEASEKTYNSKMMEAFGAEITVCPVDNVHDTIENTLKTLRAKGKNPYFIAGGGHGNIGTQAYVNCYEEIRNYERANNIHFDYIFHASGTGTTQAGLVCGQLINRDERTIVGISIARKSHRGRNVVLNSIKEYLLENKINVSDEEIENATVFDDSYIFDGYGAHPKEVDDCILDALKKYGLPLDSTYTGKAFYGMLNYLNKKELQGKKILFIHTGGTPLFFDYLNELGE